MQISQDFGRIVVLMGGESSEREVSLVSGGAVVDALSKLDIEVLPFDLTKKSLPQLASLDFDCAFIALHGPGGEDGQIQGVLEWLGKPYTGSGVLASALAMDKIRAKKVWQAEGLQTPRYCYYQDGMSPSVILAQLQLPLAVKPVFEGSSVGISRVDKPEQLMPAIHSAQKFGAVYIEEWIEGAEITVGIVGDQVLPAIRIQTPLRAFYDYQAKYVTHDTQYLLPSGLSEAQEKAVQTIAYQAYQALGCRHWGRVDLMMDKEGEFYLLELNTIPGLTPTSLVPKAAKSIGWDFSTMILKILAQAR